MHYRASRQANLLGAAALAVVDRLGERLVQRERRSLSSVAALIQIRVRPGQTIEFLARVLGLSHSTTVRLVDRLEAERLVERRRGPDGRALALFLTSSGKAAAVEADRHRAEALDAALATLSASERRQLTALLEKLLAGLTGDRWSARHICRLCDYPTCARPSCPVDQAADDDCIPLASPAPAN